MPGVKKESLQILLKQLKVYSCRSYGLMKAWIEHLTQEAGKVVSRMHAAFQKGDLLLCFRAFIISARKFSLDTLDDYLSSSGTAGFAVADLPKALSELLEWWVISAADIREIASFIQWLSECDLNAIYDKLFDFSGLEPELQDLGMKILQDRIAGMSYPKIGKNTALPNIRQKGGMIRSVIICNYSAACKN